MKFLTVAAFATIAQLASAHTTVGWVFVNGKEQGRGDVVPGGYIRKPNNNDPVKDVKSGDITCNTSKGPNTKNVNVKAGDEVTVEWFHDNRGDDIIADSHKGPVQVYIAPAQTNGKGNVWVKIASDAYSNGVWATDKLIKNKGKHSFKVPNVAGGDYIVRAEIIALHEGNRVGGAQFYPSCIQFKVAGGSGKLPAGIALPGAYSQNDPGILYDVYQQPLKPYTAPGGPVLIKG
ncbi:hypothetical protein P152DRAFT_240487 [Eremomyces bilateralis CBS 781.70]|uniref:AA9 family lytic polysaccharide monooxygenase n=1 Tax=Eremomyces bilateralis CBS 781.70 TaxID=1392243 RepID=A0A6G1GAN7_9PEZI|nr:uncharacterized protein P152DRAFT_240487 [Eremomyces bilateralis CBS 781.70]KAF1814971.1 hypothetical protein P152DRAFT_240487 [Eremomyces bilateralis CBS 781.70]